MEPLSSGSNFKQMSMDTALDSQVGGKHYKGLAIQPAEYCQRNRLPYCESSVIRYVTRHREKNKAEDIKKAIHCLQLLLELEYPENVDVMASLPRASADTPTKH
jgi:hypothetical protein